jgi:hypothetical protein
VARPGADRPVIRGRCDALAIGGECDGSCHLLVCLLPFLEYFARTDALRGSTCLVLADTVEGKLRYRVWGWLTLCSLTSFLRTLSKHPSHMRPKRACKHFSTSSSSLFDSSRNEPLGSARGCDDDRVHGYRDVEICRWWDGSKVGQVYDLRKVDNGGNEESMGRSKAAHISNACLYC